MRAEERIPLDDADGEPGEVEGVRLEQTRVLRGLPPDERAAGDPAAVGHAADDGCHPLRDQDPHREVVVEEERTSSDGDQIIDHHRHEVLPHRVEATEPARELDLGADPIGGGHEDRLAPA